MQVSKRDTWDGARITKAPISGNRGYRASAFRLLIKTFGIASMPFAGLETFQLQKPDGSGDVRNTDNKRRSTACIPYYCECMDSNLKGIRISWAHAHNKPSLCNLGFRLFVSACFRETNHEGRTISRPGRGRWVCHLFRFLGLSWVGSVSWSSFRGSRSCRSCARLGCGFRSFHCWRVTLILLAITPPKGS